MTVISVLYVDVRVEFSYSVPVKSWQNSIVGRKYCCFQ